MKFFAMMLSACLGMCCHSEAKELISPAQREVFEKLAISQSYLEAFPYGKYQICTVPQQGKFYVDIKEDSIKAQLLQGRPWEPETDQIISRYTKPGTIALDIGAHIGTHTLALSKAVGKTGMVIAFEPQQKICRELVMNLKLNGCKNVIPVHCALGDKNGEIGLNTPIWYNEGGTFVSGSGAEKVGLRKLDEFQLKNISFIKMDVENFEDMVLTGAFETLMKSRPVLFLEIQGNGEQLQASGGNRELKTRATIALLERMRYTVSLAHGADYLAIPKR